MVIADPRADAQWTVTLGPHRLTVIPDPSSTATDPTYAGTFMAQDQSEILTRRDVVRSLIRFNRGAGVVVRRDATDDGCIAWCEQGISWLANGLYPSGRQVTGGNTGPPLSTNGIIVTDSRPFNGDRYCITNGGYVLRIPNDDPSQTIAFSPALGDFNPTTSLHSGFVCTAIEVFSNSAGAPALFVAGYNASTRVTKIYRLLTTSAVWSNTRESGGAADITGFRIDKLAGPVWWENSDANGAQRLLAATTSQSGGGPTVTGFVANTILHCPYGADPMLEASWVAPIVTDPSAPITRLLTFPQFAYAVTKNGLWTFNAIRSMNVTPFAAVGSSYGTEGHAALYSAGEGYSGVVIGRGFGANYYDARDAYRLQGSVTEVGPTAHFQDGIPVRGQWTCPPVQYESWLVQAVYNHASKTAYVGRSAPRDVIGVDGPGPWAQYWSEQVLTPSASVGKQISHLVISSPTVASTGLVPQRALNLMMFWSSEPYTGTQVWGLTYAPLPLGGGPLSLQASDGTFTFALSSTFYLSAQNFDDDLSMKFCRRFDSLASLKGQAMAIYAGADVDPAQITSGGPWTLMGSISDSTDDRSVTPGTAFKGHQIGLKVLLTADAVGSGGIAGTVAPILKSIGIRAKVARPTFQVRELWVVLERDHPLPGGQLDPRAPDDVFVGVTALQDGGPQTFIDEQGVSHSVLVEQGITFQRALITDGPALNEWRTVAKLTLSLVS